MLLGGEPFPEPVLMWWNFVARSRDEIDAAYASWRDQDDRFGRVRIPAADHPRCCALLALVPLTRRSRPGAMRAADAPLPGVGSNHR